MPGRSLRPPGHLQVGLDLEAEADAFADEWVIVHHQDADHRLRHAAGGLWNHLLS
jgi:hypothetical protein